MQRTMKAAVVHVFGKPLAIEEVDVPRPGAHEVLVKIEGCAEAIERGRDADGVLAQYAPIGARAVNAFTRCRVIARYGIGADIVDGRTRVERPARPVARQHDRCLVRRNGSRAAAPLRA